MKNYSIGDWIVITSGHNGTYPENVGCVVKIEEVGERGSAKIRTTTLNKVDGSIFDILTKGCFRPATPEEIPNYEPNYEIY